MLISVYINVIIAVLINVSGDFTFIALFSPIITRSEPAIDSMPHENRMMSERKNMDVIIQNSVTL